MSKNIEIQDIFTRYSEQYLEQHKVPPHVHKVIRAIKSCRTEILGGHKDYCEECGYTRISYNSCRNRHCPKCQALAKENWIAARQAELLPVQYFHTVFTLPSELDGIVMHNQKAMYNILFKASSETVRELSLDKKYLGAEIGLISVLHTWGQNLTFHPHIHMIVPGGGITKDVKWQNSRKKFFIPVKVMAKKFRGKFLYYLRQEKLELDGSLQYLNENNNFENLISDLYKKDWYVYCKAPFKTPNSVLEYLGRYTHRVAISNSRVISCENEKVTFKWRDYKDSSKEKVMTISSEEFIRRFLMHILPPQFTKIRHYGLLASAVKKKKLILCRNLLKVKKVESPKEKLTAIELIIKLTGKDIRLCPLCGATLSRASPDYITV